MNATIISATVLRTSVRRDCPTCGRSIQHGERALRVAYKDGTRVVSEFYHPHIDEDLEQRPCAPDHRLTRLALRRIRGAPAVALGSE